ncbi:MAG TPA: hypothetical protein VL551_16740 [Actinospica sp.]|nr:hypothetical protein [Actinospica sp.]
MPWIDVVPAVCVAEPHDAAPWTVADGTAGFDEHQGSGPAVEDTPLGTFVGWALEGELAPQPILRRYRRVHFSRDRQTRRDLLWTTQKSVAKQLQHEQMRQRQDAREAERLRREQEAEARRLAAEKAEREEREWQRKIEAEAWRIEQAERTRQLTITGLPPVRCATLRSAAMGVGTSNAASGNVRPPLQRQMRGTIDPRRGGWVRRRTLRRVRWRPLR